MSQNAPMHQVGPPSSERVAREQEPTPGFIITVNPNYFTASNSWERLLTITKLGQEDSTTPTPASQLVDLAIVLATLLNKDLAAALFSEHPEIGLFSGSGPSAVGYRARYNDNEVRIVAAIHKATNCITVASDINLRGDPVFQNLLEGFQYQHNPTLFPKEPQPADDSISTATPYELAEFLATATGREASEVLGQANTILHTFQPNHVQIGKL